MSALRLAQSKTALAPSLNAYFLASGGASPYTYSVLPGGAGGAINSSSGFYTAPNAVNSDPSKASDNVQVRDSNGATMTAKILVGDPLLLFCEIIQTELGLDSGRVFLWDQKIFQPTDAGLYIAVSMPSCKPFANTSRAAGNDWANVLQSVNMLATLDLDIMSRGPDARTRKEEVILALNSIYSQQQQEGNSFYIAKLPPGSRFINLSVIDGAAIPYRYRISINIQYDVTKTKPVPYFDTFEDVEVTTNP